MTMRAIAVLIWAVSFHAMATPDVEKHSKEILPKVIEWRRHLHQNPELSNREFETAKFIAKQLKSLNLEVRTGIAKTGVVGILKGGLPGPVIGLRADMDALPITERTNVSFASKATSTYNGQSVGVMHACGHDTHVAMLLGAASVLSEMRDQVKGTVVFIFQPAEEGPPGDEEGGAALMIKEGVMLNPKIEVMFGLHIFSGLEIGTIAYKSGAAMASADQFKIVVKGKGSHGASPWAGVDPIVLGAQIVLGLQSIVSRQVDLTLAPAVITVGTINAGVRTNIIPEELTLTGTIRALDEGIQKELHKKIKITAENIAKSGGATAETSITVNLPITYNDKDLTQKMLPTLEKTVGKENLLERRWVTGAEDFSFFGEQVPAFFFWVGGMPKGQDPQKATPHHTPDFFIDDSRLDVGVKAFTNIVLDYH